MIERTECIVCGGDLSFVQVFRDFPVYMGVTEKTEHELFQDMEFCSCDKCGCVQLKKLVDPLVLYKHPHNPAIGKTWELHNKELSRFIVSTGAKTILDIGGANMKIANMVCESPMVSSYTVCDLSAGSYTTDQNGKISVIADYIENVNTDKKYDAVVLSHTFEHFYRPVDVLKKINQLTSDSGVVVVSVPNIETQLKDGFLNALNFEHTYYINDDYMKLIAAMAGFYVVSIHEFSKHNSFYMLKKSQEKAEFPSVSSARGVYENFVKSLIRDVSNLNYQTQGRSVYCFGAHIFTQMLIASGLNVGCVRGLLDNDGGKVGKFLYGTDLKVFHPSVIAHDDAPVVILRVAQYKDEIVDGLVKHNSKVQLV